jgi:amino acid adenylation domain-containing protein
MISFTNNHSSKISLECSNLVDLLRYRAIHQPSKLAFTFLQDGEIEASRLTYQELDRLARSLAAQLQSIGIANGERALLLYPPGLEFIAAFFGCLYAGVVAVPAYPPQFNRPMPRLQAIVVDAQAKVVLTTTQILSSGSRRFTHAAGLETMHWLTTDSIADRLEDSWQETAVTSDTLAFLQYTSGSTAAPKGVMVSHENILHNQRLIQRAFEHTEQSVVVGWLPLFHDMGLIGNMLQPLYLGIPCILMSPVAFLQRPLRWLEAISRYKATTSGGPNFAYDLCVSKITPEQRATLDLSSWEVAFNGAEPIRAETLERFATAFTQCGFRREAFYPCYGMAETTLIVSGGFKAAQPVLQSFQIAALEQNRVVPAGQEDVGVQMLVGCGQPLQDLQIVTAQPDTLSRCSSNEVGEIWVAGSSVAQGYWNQTEQTDHTFRAYLKDSGEGPFLRTGDLGFLKDGELFVTGRLKDLIIIRGRNHYPQDIEWTVEQSHPALQPTCGAAFSIDIAGVERLVVVQEVKRSYFRNLNVDEVIGAIRQAVVENHELQVYGVLLLKTGSIPKTSSGKIQRHACRVSFLDGRLDVVGSSILEHSYSTGSVNRLTREALLAIEPESRHLRLESYLQEQVAKVLKIVPSQLHLEHPLSSLGFDSLMAIELKNGIETSLGVVLPMTRFLQGDSIAQITRELLAGLTTPASNQENTLAPALEASVEHPLSYGQRALWFLHHLAPESSAYNIVSAVLLRAELDIPALQRAFEKLVERHPALRSVFTAPRGEPLQIVQEQIELYFQKKDVSTWNEAFLKEHLTEEAYRPFNLEQGPLMRVNLFTRSAQEHILLLSAHHIVTDFWSLAVLVQELGMLYQVEKDGTLVSLAPLALEYTTYAQWQAEMLASSEGERLWTYWQKQLAGELPVLNLATDRPRPPLQTYRGASVPFKLSTALTQKLKTLSRAHRATLYMTLLAAFQVLLYRYTGQEDILVGSPTAGRSWAELAGLVGYFVNPVVLRADLSENPTFEVFLERVRQTVLEAFENQDYPFTLLVERLQPIRDPSRSPLFQVMFVLQKAYLLNEEGLTLFALGETGARMNLGRLELESFPLEQRVTQFDLTLVMAEVDEGLTALFEYNADMFDASTIHRMVGHFLTLLEGIVANSRQHLSDLPLLTEVERHQLVVEWNDTRSEYPKDACIHQLFEAQVERTPDAIAVVYQQQQLTYRQLNNRSNRLAKHLQQLGVAPEVVVGICLERSVDFIVGLLGILKAGGAYLPLDPSYPCERLLLMLKEAQAPVLLTDTATINQSSFEGLRLDESLASTCVVYLNQDRQAIASQSDENPVNSTRSENLAYVMYTSGSTGKPKAVAVTHKAVNRLVCNTNYIKLGPSFKIAQISNTSFDAVSFEIWGALVHGAQLVGISKETMLSPQQLARQLRSSRIDVLFLTTAVFEQVVVVAPQAFATLKYLLFGGEVAELKRVQQVLEHGCPEQLVHVYGPTESTTFAAYYRVQEVEEQATSLPIGRPVANTQIYLLDAQQKPVPLGVVGEIYIGGAGLARGYLNDPHLTATRFIPNRFSNNPTSKLYKSGDLGRYSSDGNIHFVGRRDHQVKIRGYRIELGEIEVVLTQHPLLQKSIVIVREDNPDNKYLVAYVVAKQTPAPTSQELRHFLQQKLPAYMLPSAFVLLDTLPLTANGKVDRCALPAPNTARPELSGAYVPPRTPLEEMLVGIWIDILGLKQVGVHDNFFELGGHSLLATQLLWCVSTKFSVELPLRSLFEEPTVAALAERIKTAYRAEPSLPALPLKSLSRDVKIPLSSRLLERWLYHQSDRDWIDNLSVAMRFVGSLNTVVLERSFNEILRRHEALRTTFPLVDGQPIQVISPVTTLSIPVVDLRALPKTEREARAIQLATEEAQRRFDLGQELLLRATLLRLSEEEHVLLLVIHHIVVDAWSLGLLSRELATLYTAFTNGDPLPLPELPIQFADFIHWEYQWERQSEFVEAQMAYWKQQLGGDLPRLELPTDQPRPVVLSKKVARMNFIIPQTLSESLRILSSRERATLFMTLLAAFKSLLHCYTGQNDLIVCSSVVNRSHVETEALVGYFANGLLLRSDLSGNPTFRELLGRVREVVIRGYEHQNLPFPMLVKALSDGQPSNSRLPFQVLFSLQNIPIPSGFQGLTVSPLKGHSTVSSLGLNDWLGVSAFELSMYVLEQEEELTGFLIYNTDLFNAATMTDLLRRFQKTLEGISVDPEQQLSSLCCEK